MRVIKIEQLINVLSSASRVSFYRAKQRAPYLYGKDA